MVDSLTCTVRDCGKLSGCLLNGAEEQIPRGLKPARNDKHKAMIHRTSEVVLFLYRQAAF
jgi:hypothetical protein